MPSTLGLITKRRTRNADGTYPQIDTITGTSYSKYLSGYPDKDLFLISEGFSSVGNTDESTGLSFATGLPVVVVDRLMIQQGSLRLLRKRIY